jgi:hypothetical protein
MSDRQPNSELQNRTQRGRRLLLRGALGLAGTAMLSLADGASVNVPQLGAGAVKAAELYADRVATASRAALIDGGSSVNFRALPSGLFVASDPIADRLQAAANAGCGPLPTDGRPPLCTTTENDIYGQSYFGGFYFEDDGDFEFTSGTADDPIQGVKDRQILVEEIRFAGSGDFVQLNPKSRRVNGSEVSYEDVKAGKNSGTRFVERWTVFRLPADGGDGLGIDLRTGSNRLLIAINGGSLVDKVWAPIDDGKRAERHECSGDCGWNCVRFIQFTRLKAGTVVDLNKVIPNEAIHTDQRTGRLSSYTDYIWLWDTMDLSNAHVDYSAISTPLTEDLRRSEGVVRRYVNIPGRVVPYTNHSR